MIKKHQKFDHHLPGVHFYGERGEIPVRINVTKFSADQEFPEDPLHYHKKSHQFFVVLEGALEFEIDGEIHHVDSSDVLEILPETTYRTVRHVGDTSYVMVGTCNEDGDRVQIDS